MKNTKESMLAHKAQWEQSGLTKKVYCKRENISYQGFGKFCSRLKQKGQGSGFVLIEPTVCSTPITLHLPNGCYFTVPVDCSPALLRNLIQACSA